MKLWYKGNLHMHSLWSDGEDFPESIAASFKARGYNFIALTEHDQLAVGERWIEPKPGLLERYRAIWDKHHIALDFNDKQQVRLKTLAEYRKLLEEPDKFLILSGEEITTYWPSKTAWETWKPGDEVVASSHGSVHWINAINLSTAVPEQVCKGGSHNAINQTIAAVKSSSDSTNTIVSLNHPNFLYNARAEEICQADELGFMEIHTALTSCNCYGSPERAGAERIWDIVLSLRLAQKKRILYGIATDDSHFYHESDYSEYVDNPVEAFPFRAWVMVRSDSLTGDSLMAAMKRGDFYASTGVTLSDFDITEKKISLKIKAEEGVSYTTKFIGTVKGFNQNSTPVLDKNDQPLLTTAQYSEDIGKVLKEEKGAEASYTYTGDELYVRAVVVSDQLHSNPAVPGDTVKAWIQPVVIS